MTTVIADLEGMASDERVSEEGAPHYPASKIFRVGNSLFGTAGHGDMCLVMLEWLKTAQRSRMALYKQWNDYDRDQIVLLELRTPGELYRWTGWGLPERILTHRWAIGSGAAPALATYDKSKSLKEAVEAGMEYDQYSGGKVRVELLKNVSRTRRKR